MLAGRPLKWNILSLGLHRAGTWPRSHVDLAIRGWIIFAFGAFSAIGLVSVYTVWGFLLSALGVTLGIIDAQKRILPNVILGLGAAAAAAIELFFAPLSLHQALLGAVALGGLGLLIAATTHGLGMGDVKFLALIGWFLGPLEGFLALSLALLFAAGYSLLALHRQKLTQAIAFGPALAAGALFMLMLSRLFSV